MKRLLLGIALTTSFVVAQSAYEEGKAFGNSIRNSQINNANSHANNPSSTLSQPQRKDGKTNASNEAALWNDGQTDLTDPGANRVVDCDSNPNSNDDCDAINFITKSAAKRPPVSVDTVAKSGAAITANPNSSIPSSYSACTPSTTTQNTPPQTFSCGEARDMTTNQCSVYQVVNVDVTKNYACSTTSTTTKITPYSYTFSWHHPPEQRYFPGGTNTTTTDRCAPLKIPQCTLTQSSSTTTKSYGRIYDGIEDDTWNNFQGGETTTTTTTTNSTYQCLNFSTTASGITEKSSSVKQSETEDVSECQANIDSEKQGICYQIESSCSDNLTEWQNPYDPYDPYGSFRTVECDAQGYCSPIETPSDPPKTRIINGVPVTKSCWAYTRKYACSQNTVSTSCYSYQTDPSCKFTSATCKDGIHAPGDLANCLFSSKTFTCGGTSTASSQLDCGTQSFCVDGNCNQAPTQGTGDGLIEGYMALKTAENGDINGLQQPPDAIFKGDVKTCKRSFGSWSGGFMDCCTESGLFSAFCSNESKEIFKPGTYQRIHRIGDYCSKDIRLFCWELTDAYCVFPSQLARILQEQARPQLGKGFGNAERPDCSGLTPEDLKKLDFSKMNLEELTKAISPKLQTLTADKAKEIIDKFSASPRNTKCTSTSTDPKCKN